MGYRSGLTGILKKPALKGVLDRRARVMLPEQGEYAYISTAEALKNAGLDQDFIDKHEIGIIFGNDSSAQAVIEATDIIRAKKDTMLVGSGSVFQALNFTVSAACASGSHAIGLGAMFIRDGMQDCIICGGAQETNFYSMGNFDALGAFSIRESDPTTASRPFDRDRDGLVPSGGAATVIIESLEFAQKRGAKILGEVIGYGFSSNGQHISNPSVEGPMRSLQLAMKSCGLSAKDIDYINAHATSTPNGDAKEANAISEVFNGAKVPVSSTKSMTGHECWMAGASEIVYSLQMMQNSFISPNINFETPDSDSEKLNIITKTIDKNIDVFLSNSFGFGGTNSTLIVKKWK
jgi:3-oxoacyl-[acyl-carrier-protein] synthase-1